MQKKTKITVEVLSRGTLLSQIKDREILFTLQHHNTVFRAEDENKQTWIQLGE